MTVKSKKSKFESLDELENHLGEEVGVSDWLLIDQNLIDKFGTLTRDEQWIHSDPERARVDSPFQTTIAHGFLVLSLLSHFLEGCIQIDGIKMGINYGFDKIRFINPVKVNVRIRGRFRLLTVEKSKERVKYKYGASIEIEGEDKPALVAEWIALAFS